MLHILHIHVYVCVCVCVCVYLHIFCFEFPKMLIRVSYGGRFVFGVFCEVVIISVMGVYYDAYNDKHNPNEIFKS